MSDLLNYLSEVNELPREALLGHIVIYTINDGAYELDRLTADFTDLGLDPKFLPSAAKPIDAYRKATNDADDFEYALPNGNVAHILVRDVSADNEMVERHLVREIRDGRRRTLAHSKVGEAVFYRPKIEKGKTVQDSHRFRLNILHGELASDERTPLQVVVDKITNSFDRHLNYLDGMKVRAMVREYVKSLSGIELKPSVYFIPVSQYDELKRVTELVSRLHHGCSMQLMPLINMAEQKDMVIEAYQKDAENNLTDLVEKITNLRTTRKSITAEAFAKIKGEYEDIMAKAERYRSDLGISQDRTAGAAESAQSALRTLARTLLDGAA